MRPFAPLLFCAALGAGAAARAQQPRQPDDPEPVTGEPAVVLPQAQEQQAPAQPEPPGRIVRPQRVIPPQRARELGLPDADARRRGQQQQRPPARPAPNPNRPAIAPQTPLNERAAPGPTRSTPPPATTPVDKQEAARNSRSVVMNFDKRDLVEVIQFVSNYTGRNFILPERVAGKITILSNQPIPPDEVWNVFVAALDANNWAVYPVGHYWKLSEKKQSARGNIPTYLEPGVEPPANEQMVTKLFKLRYVEADQMRNTLNQFTSRDSDFQIFPPDTLIISDVGLNMRRLERLIDQLDQPGGSEEIHIVQVLYAGAAELQQKLQEIFTQQQGRPGLQRALGVAEPVAAPVVPGQPVPPQQQVQQQRATGPLGPVQVSKIIAEERTNKLIVIAGARSFSRVLELIKQLDVPAGGGGVQVYYLQNAKAEDVAQTLQALAQGVTARRTTGGATPTPPGGAYTPPVAAPQTPAPGVGTAAVAELFRGEVKITADKTTNSLVIIASASDYRNLVKVIEKLDVPRREVLVEAVIMEVNLSDETDLGVSSHAGSVISNVNFRGASGDATFVGGTELGGLSSLGGLVSLGSLNGFLAGLQGPPITVGGLQLPSFAILLNALQSSSDVNVISTPHVTMVDNTEGEITVGQNVPFQAGYAPNLGGLLGTGTTTTGTTTTGTTTAAGLGIGALGLGGLGSLYAPIQRQNVELRLRIKPQISASDTVRLEVDESTEEIASVDKTLGPTTSKRSAKTTVVVKDQETVVLGGLIQDRTVKDVQKVPFLGSLPLLGWFFRNETTRKQRTNLLLFLTPYIIRDQSDYRRIFERKMAERTEFVKRFYGNETNYNVKVDYERKPGPLTELRRSVRTEMSRAENGGPGVTDERVIGPTRPNVPPALQTPETTPPGLEMPIQRQPPNPAPETPNEQATPPPGTEQPVVPPSEGQPPPGPDEELQRQQQRQQQQQQQAPPEQQPTPEG
jgi:general secretion pathway protein D